MGFRISVGNVGFGGGALYLAALFDNWFLVYTAMASCISIGMITTLLMPKPPLLHRTKAASIALNSPSFNRPAIGAFFKKTFALSLTSFFNKRDWLLILGFIFFFKVGDTVLNMMTLPFLLEIGFTKVEIAHIAKSFGILAMIVGGILGGILLSYISMMRNLVLCIGLQMISCVMFMFQAYLGHDILFLVLTMGIENLACGISAATLVLYFSRLCQAPYTATHYALLSSFSSISRLALSMLAGWLADFLSWTSFYALVTIGCLPCLILLLGYPTRFFLSEQTNMKLNNESRKVTV